MDNLDADLTGQPICHRASTSKKRKQPDNDPILLREGPLTDEPIENEYDEIDEDEDEIAGNLKDEDYKMLLKSQQPATINYDGEIKITPFNLEEELEEGELDKAGNFVFHKKEKHAEDDEQTDSWAESVDWAEVRVKEQNAGSAHKSQVDDEFKKPGPRVLGGMIGAYKSLLRIIKPDETVQRAIRRLGNEIPKRRARRTRPEENDKGAESHANVNDAREKLDNLIELSHYILEEGDTDIYQKSFEDIEETINR